MEEFDFDELLNEIGDTKSVKEPNDYLDIIADVEAISTSPAINKVDISDIQETDIEYVQETDAYIRAKLQLEAEMQALKEEQKSLKDEFKEQGVDIKSADKAISEIKKELKETAVEAKLVEDLKNRYRKDSSIYASIESLVG